MSIAIGSPGRYIQGPGELQNLCKYASVLGKNLFVVATEGGRQRVESHIQSSLAQFGCRSYFAHFNGECSMMEIDRLAALARDKNVDVVIGVGGGKALDTAKAVAYYTGTRLMIVPTSAAQDAPCLALSVIYSEGGVIEKYLEYPTNPDYVVVDSDVCAKAPARLFASGMGDALATFYESRACIASRAKNGYGYDQSQNSMMQARLCYDILKKDGIQAYYSVKSGIRTKAVENVIEANIYLSGIGAEGCGDAGAHGIHNALLVLPETRGYYHGERVAFGILVQMVLENAPLPEIEEVIKFNMEIGLPVTLEEIGIIDISKERIMAVAQYALGDTLQNEPFDLTVDDIFIAVMGADMLGRRYKNKGRGPV